MTDKEKEFMEKIAEKLPYLSEFDKGYFLGVAEAKAGEKETIRHQCMSQTA